MYVEFSEELQLLPSIDAYLRFNVDYKPKLINKKTKETRCSQESRINELDGVLIEGV